MLVSLINIIFSLTQVFHGADNDVLWLQRDFHIYVVNLFDTAKVVSFFQHNVIYLSIG